MSRNDPPDHPTLLLMPRWLGWTEERILPLSADAYRIDQIGRDWFAVVELPTARCVYSGIGPVEVVVSRAPF